MPTSPEKHAKYMREVWYPRNREVHKKLVARNNRRVVKARRDFVNLLKDSPCMDCGNKFPPCVMDFDHVRGKKTMPVTMGISRRWTEKRLLEEIAKCDLVCANCHRIRTHITRK